MKIGSLFSGIGGLELGLERAGLGSVSWQVEIDPFARRVLAKHWPNVERFEDVRRVGKANLAPVDLICGGFPCQNLSSANVKTRTGIGGEKSGLWSEYARIVAELAPRWVVVENAPNWRAWVPTVCGDLERLGYCVHPVALDSADLGAPHSRRRVFVVAHAHGQSQCPRTFDAEVASVRAASRARRDWGQTPPGGWRVDDGAPHGVDRSRAIGNAVVPQVAEVVGRAIAAAIKEAA